MNNSIWTIAHRGYSGIAPENTMAAFKLALDAGAECIELDVQLCKDGEVIVLHDYTLERTTTLTGKPGDFTLDELKHADAGSWFSPEFANERIPALAEVIDLVRGKAALNIEIKVANEYIKVVENTLSLLQEMNFYDIMISSFSREALEEVKRKRPDIKTGYLFENKLMNYIYKGEWEYLCAHYSLAPLLMHKARLAGKKVYVWTVNTKAEMEEMIALGVDGIISNYPLEAKRLIK